MRCLGIARSARENGYASYAFDETGFLSNDKTSIIATKDRYLFGILNSKVADVVVHSISSTKQGGYFEYKPMYVKQIPISVIDFSNPDDVARHDRMVSLVEQMLSLQNPLPEARTPHELDSPQAPGRGHRSPDRRTGTASFTV